MKPISRSLPWLLAVLVLSAAGCGGDGHRSSGAETRLTFTATSDYNGASADLRGGATAEVGTSTVTVTLTDGARTLVATVPQASLVPGQTVTPTDAGVDIRYAETVAGGTDVRRWRATAGTITYTRIGNGTLDARVESLGFAAVTENAVDVAAGTFAADGRIVRVPILRPL